MTKDAYFPATGMPDAEWWSALWPNPEAVLRKVGITAGQSAIDLCCGDGLFTVPLCALVGELGQVYALDLDSQLLAAAKDRMEKQGPAFAGKTCTWIEADACHFDEALDGPVDVVLMANTFHGVPDKAALGESVRRALKPDGRFVVINWHARPRQQTTVLGQPRGPKTEMRLSPDQVGQILSATGFKAAQIVDLPPWHYGAMFRVAKATPEA